MTPLRIGMIGYGFMAKAHTNAHRKVNHFFDLEYQPVLKTVCGLVDAEVAAFAKRWGYESHCTDWRQVVERKDIDLVEICVPNSAHAEIAIAAAKAGKMVLCEKPLALNGPQALKMVQAVEKAGVANFVSFNYRRVPAVTLAKKLIDEGRLGRIFHYRANFLQDWTISANVPQGGMATWRLDVKAAGSGVTGDLLAHCIDTAMWQNGPITRVNALTETFVKERKNVETGKVEPVGIDDA
jgi:predicted dehydrogenase